MKISNLPSPGSLIIRRNHKIQNRMPSLHFFFIQHCQQQQQHMTTTTHLKPSPSPPTLFFAPVPINTQYYENNQGRFRLFVSFWFPRRRNNLQTVPHQRERNRDKSRAPWADSFRGGVNCASKFPVCVDFRLRVL